jgi:hypothetical protein
MKQLRCIQSNSHIICQKYLNSRDTNFNVLVRSPLSTDDIDIRPKFYKKRINILDCVRENDQSLNLAENPGCESSREFLHQSNISTAAINNRFSCVAFGIAKRSHIVRLNLLKLLTDAGDNQCITASAGICNIVINPLWELLQILIDWNFHVTSLKNSTLNEYK